MLSGFHLRIARAVLRAAEPFGFALGGGYALQAHRITDRPSADIDGYASVMDSSVFDGAEAAVVGALDAAGLAVDVVKRDSWFRALLVSDPETDEAVVVDLGYDYRRGEPVGLPGIGPVLSLEDVVAGKVRALYDRQAARDFLDIDAVLASGRWSVADLQTILDAIRPEAGPGGIRSLLSRADAVEPDEYQAYGISPDQARTMIRRLARAAKSSP
jgi:hypothetical protein